VRLLGPRDPDPEGLSAWTQALKTVNVLEDDGIRQGIKEYSNWPTIPQLYVKGEFIGGSDIMMEMYESGELQQVVNGSPA
jgi:monothiol glutaredoxin